jgi:hypothetical protein
MRLPFLQLESDLIAHGAPEVAALSGCSIPMALGHIALLRAWAVSRAEDDVPPDGWVEGEAAGRRIEAAAQWTGERGKLLQALKDAGQVHEESGGLRVLHLEPYAKAWEQNQKSKERMRTLRERSANTDKRSDSGSLFAERSANFDGQTQTQTQIEDPSGADAPPLARPAQTAKRRVARQPGKPPDHRHAPLVKALTSAGWPFDGGKDAAHVTALLALADQREATHGEAAPAEVMRRAKIARDQDGFNSARTLGDFRAHWGRFERPEARRGNGVQAPVMSDFSAVLGE